MRRSGFTLVEILIVVVIIAILIGLALPALQSAMIRGLAAKSTSNLRQLVIANQAFAADFGHFAPSENLARTPEDFENNNVRWCGARESESDPWDPSRGYLSDYLGNNRSVTPCPLFMKMVGGDEGSFEEGAGGYGYNSSYIGGRAGSYQVFQSGPFEGARIPERPGNIKRSRTVMFATSAYATGDSVQEYPFIEPPFWAFGPNQISSMRPSPTVHFRFNGKALVAWCDGQISAEEMDPREEGENRHGGDADAQMLGWFGPDEENGYWNPRRSYSQQP